MAECRCMWCRIVVTIDPLKPRCPRCTSPRLLMDERWMLVCQRCGGAILTHWEEAHHEAEEVERLHMNVFRGNYNTAVNRMFPVEGLTPEAQS